MQNKFVLSLLIVAFSLSGCGGNQTKETTAPADTTPPAVTPPPVFLGLSKVELHTSYEIDAQVTTHLMQYNWGDFFGYETSPVTANGKLSFELSRLGPTGYSKLDMVSGGTAKTFADPWYSAGFGEGALVDLGDNSTVRLILDSPFEYQLFGFWKNTYSSVGLESVEIASFSAGQKSPFTLIPTSQTQTFLGAILGYYIPPNGAEESLVGGTLKVVADFDTKMIDLETFDTNVRAEPIASLTGSETKVYVPSLEFSGSLAYSNENAFQGQITNAAGNLGGFAMGAFYGPNAEELGGTFWMNSNDPLINEQYNGSFGAISAREFTGYSSINRLYPYEMNARVLTNSRIYDQLGNLVTNSPETQDEKFYSQVGGTNRIALTSGVSKTLTASVTMVPDNYIGSPLTILDLNSISLQSGIFSAGYEYQSFGIWNTGGTKAVSAGQKTPISEIAPITTREFVGQTIGSYSGSRGLTDYVMGKANISADFENKRITLVATDFKGPKQYFCNTCTTYRDPNDLYIPINFYYYAELDFTTVMTYSNDNYFKGTILDNGYGMTGSAEGSFYGPYAAEIGGSIFLESLDKTKVYIGAYGAKRVP